MKCDHIKRMIKLTGDNIKRLSLYHLSHQRKLRNILKLWDSTKIVGRSQNEMFKTLIFLSESMYSFILIWDKLLPYKKIEKYKIYIGTGSNSLLYLLIFDQIDPSPFFFKKKICQQEIQIVKKQKKRNASVFCVVIVLCC